MTPNLKIKILAATVGTKFGAILRCALDTERDLTPRFIGSATVTSDGFVMCSFIDSNGTFHPGAFVGALSDIDLNASGLRKHLSLNADEYDQLTIALAG